MTNEEYAVTPTGWYNRGLKVGVDLPDDLKILAPDRWSGMDVYDKFKDSVVKAEISATQADAHEHSVGPLVKAKRIWEKSV